MYKGQTTLDPGFFYCPIMPDGTDLRPVWRARRRQEAADRGWCLKLFDEMNPPHDPHISSVDVRLVRQIFPGLIAVKIAGVQPLLGPPITTTTT